MNRVARIAVIIGIIGVGVFAFIVLWRQPAPQAKSGVSVVTSFYPLYFFASEIGGDRADVINLTPAGAEPHDYEPTPQDVARIESATLLVLNGGGLEAWYDSVKPSIESDTTTVVYASEGLMTRRIVEEGEDIVDPHVWLSPVLAEQMVDKIAEGYAHVDPANAEYYAGNAAALKAKLGLLDTEYRQALASCASRDIITSHAAFGYLGATYGLKQVPISGVSPEEEPSPRQLADVADFAKKNGVKYIFFESRVSPKLSQTIATEVGAKTLVLDPIEGLSDDDLAAGKNYLSVMQSNLANLKIALECN